MGRNIPSSFALAVLVIAALSTNAMRHVSVALADQTERVPADVSGQGAQPSAVTPGTNEAAQSPNQAPTLNHSASGQATDEFIKNAAQHGSTDEVAAQFALAHSQSADVKTFAQHVLHRQQQINSQLRDLAERKGITVPTGLDASDHRLIDALQANSGAKLDAAYARAMADDHQKQLTLYKRAAADQHLDREVQKFAQAKLPGLQDELQMANKLDAAHSNAHS